MIGCGPCTQCCSARSPFTISDVKTKHTDCSLLDPSGCVAYAKRPRGCRVWSCMWLMQAGNFSALLKDNYKDALTLIGYT